MNDGYGIADSEFQGRSGWDVSHCWTTNSYGNEDGDDN